MIPDERIAQVHAADVTAARRLLAEAVSTARECWIPVDAIADALVQELVECTARGSEPARMSAYLRGLAALIDRSAVTAAAN